MQRLASTAGADLAARARARAGLEGCRHLIRDRPSSAVGPEEAEALDLDSRPSRPVVLERPPESEAEIAVGCGVALAVQRSPRVFEHGTLRRLARWRVRPAAELEYDDRLFGIGSVQ